MGYPIQPLQPLFFLFGALFAPLVALPFILWLSRWLKSQVGWIAAFSSFLSLFCLVIFFNWFGAKPYILFQTPWFSSLQLSFSVMSDGLSLLFGGGVSLMAIIVSIYAKDHIESRDSTRFFVMFLGLVFSSLGMIFSNDLMVIFIFFQLFGFFTFLFIGFRFYDFLHYRYAFLCLITWAVAAILLCIGGLLFYQQFGSFDILSLSQLVSSVNSVSNLTVSLSFIFVGLLIGLAHVPFHTWITKSIQAPFSFSLFLNSIGFASGLYILLRLWPFFQSVPFFLTVLLVVGSVGFVISSLYALCSHDSRLALLYTTLAHSGFCLILLGISQLPLFAVSFSLMSHFLYKGLLFLVLGVLIVYGNATDLRQQYGLFKSHWFLGLVCLVGCLSLAGFPGTLGFIDHLSLITALLDFQSTSFALSTFVMVMVTIGQLCIVAVSLRLFYSLFLGSASPSRSITLGVVHLEFIAAVLAIPLVLFGLFPLHAYHFLHAMGLAPLSFIQSIPLWYTTSTSFIVSVIIIFLGCIIYGLLHLKKWPIELPSFLQWDHYCVSFMDHIVLWSSKCDQFLKFDRPQQLILVSIGFFSFVLAIISSIIHQTYAFSLPSFSSVSALYYIFSGIILILCLSLLYSSQWLTKFIIFFGLMLSLSVYYILYRAPELAFFQLLFTLFLLIFVFILLKKIPTYRFFSHTPLNWSFLTLLKLVISGSFGVSIVIVLSEVLMHQHTSPLGTFLLDKSDTFFPETTNFVTMFLSHIRAFDTVIVATIIAVCLFSCVLSHPSSIRGERS